MISLVPVRDRVPRNAFYCRKFERPGVTASCSKVAYFLHLWTQWWLTAIGTNEGI